MFLEKTQILICVIMSLVSDQKRACVTWSELLCGMCCSFSPLIISHLATAAACTSVLRLVTACFCFRAKKEEEEAATFGSLTSARTSLSCPPNDKFLKPV